jgi:hypothetical protein
VPCSYYAGFWDGNIPPKDPPQEPIYAIDSNKDFEKEFYRIQSLKKKYGERRNKVLRKVIALKFLAAVGVLAIPLLTYYGFKIWNPSPPVLAIADFAVANTDDPKSMV